MEKSQAKYRLRIDVITAFPDMFDSVVNASMIKIAREKNALDLRFWNLHDFADDKFRHIDSPPYGGGAGMIIKCKPVFACVEKLLSERKYDEVIFVCADGERLDQSIANELSLKSNLMIIAGHYKGIDQRIRDALVTREISIGDYVLSGGELPAMVMIDSLARLIPGVIGDAESALEDSFQDGLLEPPQYAKPADFREMKVPEVLLGGNHAEIREWRLERSLEKTRLRRPDLLE